jgi:dihydrofolate synthase/folylpolyglutamate synthase
VTGATGEALAVVAARATEVGAPLSVCTALPVVRMDLDGLVLREARLGELRLSLLGRHQAQNAAVALGIVTALETAGVAQVPDAAITAGLATVRWPGRLERIEVGGALAARPLTVILDGAHNPDGAAALADALDELAPGLPAGTATLLLGILADKDVTAIVESLARSRAIREARCVTTRVPDTDRSLDARTLAAAWEARAGARAGSVIAVHDYDAALDRALQLAAEVGGPLIVTGSLYLVGHVRARLLPDPSA